MDTTLEAMLRDAQHVAPVYQPYLLCRRLASPVALTFPSPSSIPASLNMRSRKTSTNSSKESPVTTTKGDLAPRFDRLISLIEEQNKIMGEQGKTLKEHSTMLEALEKDATRDDKAYEGRSLKDESTWGALDKEALAKMKVAVDGWKDLMNVSLIFIALFLTVVTAFISPIIQLFSTPSSTNPSSSSSSKPPLPPTSLQLVALFYCLALMFSICNSVMCVLGLQWSGRLLSVPQGKTNLERTLNRERRKLLAEKRLLPLMSVLFWTVLLSIAFFVVGFLIQLWALSFSFEERASILIISAVAATALAITILGVILATTYHATIYENSPFESPLSSASITAWAWINQVLKKVKAGSKKRKDSGQRWHLHQPTISPLDRFRRRVQWTVGKLSRPPGPSRHESSRKAVEVIGKIESEQREEEPLEALMTEKAEDNENVKALKGYARLVINTNDTEVLERAVASFEITEWWKNGAELLPVFLAVRERFLATDTSFRVKETVTKRLSDCREWSGWRSKHGWRSDIEGNAITRWCRDHCNELVYRSRESHCQFFAAFVFFTSLDSNNKDLRKLPWEGSYEKSVVRVLSSFDQDQPYGLGNRYFLFRSAAIECGSLLEDGRSDDVTRILSFGDQSSVLRSLLRNPYIPWDFIKDIVGFITQGHEARVLNEMAGFFSNLPGIRPVRQELLVIEFLGSLIPTLPSTFSVPGSFELSSVLNLLLSHESDIEGKLPHYAHTLLYFLDHGGFETLSSFDLAHDFFRLCLTPSANNFPSKNNQDRARAYLDQHGALNALPGPSEKESQNLLGVIVRYQGMTSDDVVDTVVDAIKECDSICRTGRGIEMKVALSQIDHISLLGILCQNPRISGRHILALLALILEGDVIGCMHAAPVLLSNLPWVGQPDGDLPILAFLASLIPFLPSNYVVPPEFDLSQTLTLFMRNDPDRRTWRKYSDALIQYLDRGALETLSNKDSVQGFLHLCIHPSDEMRFAWTPDQQPSEFTCDQAAELEKKLFAVEEYHSSSESFGSVVPNLVEPSNVETGAPWWPVALQMWRSVGRQLGRMWRWSRKAENLDTSGDVELALPHLAQF